MLLKDGSLSGDNLKKIKDMISNFAKIAISFYLLRTKTLLNFQQFNNFHNQGEILFLYLTYILPLLRLIPSVMGW